MMANVGKGLGWRQWQESWDYGSFFVDFQRKVC